MDLNNLKLSNTVISELYKNSLVEFADYEKDNPALPEKEKPGYLGDNLKKILIVVSHKHIPFLPDTELNFLTKLLSACSFSLSDVAILNYASEKKIPFTEHILSLQSKYVLFFGLTPSDLDLPVLFPHFQIQAFNQVTYLGSPSLGDIEHDVSQKKKLWECLKKIFNL